MPQQMHDDKIFTCTNMQFPHTHFFLLVLKCIIDFSHVCPPARYPSVGNLLAISKLAKLTIEAIYSQFKKRHEAENYKAFYKAMALFSVFQSVTTKSASLLSIIVLLLGITYTLLLCCAALKFQLCYTCTDLCLCTGLCLYTNLRLSFPLRLSPVKMCWSCH